MIRRSPPFSDRHKFSSSTRSRTSAWVLTATAAAVICSFDRAEHDRAALWQGTPLPQKRYPRLDLAMGGRGSVEVLREEPPVWLVRNFMSKEDCRALIEEGRRGSLPVKVYETTRVAFDEQRLQPLLFTAPLSAAGAYFFHEGDFSAVAAAFCAALVAVFLFKEALVWYLSNAAASGGKGGARFLGSKWQLGPTPTSLSHNSVGNNDNNDSSSNHSNNGNNNSNNNGNSNSNNSNNDSTRVDQQQQQQRFSTARQQLLETAKRLFNVPSVRYLEPPYLTRYRLGEGQSKHLDSKELPSERWSDADLKAFEANGKQRMVQCLCYLNDVDVEHGGATVFHEKALADLKVQPEVGSALVFCVAFEGGEEDVRMVHSADPIRGEQETEKWVVPIWSLQAEHKNWEKWLQPEDPMLS
eukprot:TRINITY_DN9367_c1_g1_i1.p1 TRINITY_DN9367_c1_g1~~TRINITY_DN9367_c1_g1_i1.p1  ORF type:complete len:412 (-),score=94.91 TRINITY_DN9367_c1_g1_i1:96-1331(-)